MNPWFDVLSFALIGAAVAPLLLLAAYGLASWLELPLADRLLSAIVSALKLQWGVGGVVNIVLGMALAGAGLWLAVNAATPLPRLLVVVMAPLGLWRVWRGVLVLRGFRETDKRRS